MWAIGCAVALACAVGLLVILFRGSSGLQEVLAIEGHAGHAQRVAFVGSSLVARFDAGVGVYSVADGRQLAFSSDLAQEADPFSVSPRGDLAAIGRSVVRLPDLAPVSTLPENWRGATAFTPDGSLIACVRHDRDVAAVASASLDVVEPRAGRIVRSVRLPAAPVSWPAPCSVVVSPDGSTIVVGRARHLDIVVGDDVQQLLLPVDGAVEALAWDGRGLRAATRARLVRWAAPGSAVPPEVVSIETRAPSRFLERNWIWSVALAPDGRRAAVGWHHPGVALVGDGPVLWGDHVGVYDAAFSGDGALLATAGYDNHLRVWRVPPFASPAHRRD
jgi:WD40 repeat protein